MYQLVIIDDEPIVRSGIKQLIPWENYNFEICAEGFDGKDGLKKVLEYSPDLVLVDVKMPGMSGIDLIREAKKNGFEGKFIILTGYSDFEFAKSAITLGVRAYLLKPIDENELQENVQEVLAELDAKKNLDDYYSLSELKARKEVLHRLLLHSEDKNTLRHELKLYGMDFKYHCFCAAILSTGDSFIDHDSADDKERIDLILKDLGNTDNVMVDDKLVLISKGCTYQDLLSKLLKNNERVKRHFKDGFFIAVGHDVANWEDLHFSYECAKLLMNYEFLYKDHESISIDMLKGISGNIDSDFMNQVCSLIEIGDVEEITKAVDALKKFFKAKLMKEHEIKVMITQNMVLINSILERRYEDKKKEMPDFNILAEGIKNAESLDGLMDLVTIYCIEASESIGSSAAGNVVKRMIAYMTKHYDQDLKLEGIAKIFNYNSAYLGKIFKKEMKESFNNVLDSIRIENAKRLLLRSDLKVYQVSEQVGYSNIDYFYYKFKKYVGISPKEFKKK